VVSAAAAALFGPGTTPSVSGPIPPSGRTRPGGAPRSKPLHLIVSASSHLPPAARTRRFPANSDAPIAGGTRSYRIGPGRSAWNLASIRLSHDEYVGVYANSTLFAAAHSPTRESSLKMPPIRRSAEAGCTGLRRHTSVAHTFCTAGRSSVGARGEGERVGAF